MTDYAAVLAANYSGAEWSLNGDDYAGLVWHSDSPMPSQEELDAAWPAVRDAAKWDAVRVERDRLLAQSDWTRMDDAPLSDVERAAWAVYRQALRDVPQTFGSPDDVVWPEVPS